MTAIFDMIKDMLITLGNYFAILFGGIGFLDVVLIIPIVFCVYRLILVPLFGLKISLGSDKASKRDKADTAVKVIGMVK